MVNDGFPIGTTRWGQLYVQGDIGKRTSGVYAIKHVRSGRAYIGSAVDIGRRVTEHLNFILRGESPKPLVDDWKADGPSGFVLIVLDEIADPDRETLTRAEQKWLNHFIDAPPYNVYHKVWRPR